MKTTTKFGIIAIFMVLIVASIAPVSAEVIYGQYPLNHNDGSNFGQYITIYQTGSSDIQTVTNYNNQVDGSQYITAYQYGGVNTQLIYNTNYGYNADQYVNAVQDGSYNSQIINDVNNYNALTTGMLTTQSTNAYQGGDSNYQTTLNGNEGTGVNSQSITVYQSGSWNTQNAFNDNSGSGVTQSIYAVQG